MLNKLLVVEDSKPIARVIRQIGVALNYEVTIASTLAEVEQILQKENDFFAATIDYTLPDAQDGEAIKYILSHGIPGVVMTGKMDDETRSKILAQPVIDYIPKENSQAFMYLKRILHWQQTNKENGVLVVDDSLSARNHIVELLKRRNFTVYIASDGESALDILAQHRNIKVVITDLEMPVMDGITLTNEIRKKYSRDQMAVIGISGATSGIHSARFIKNGADDFLRKPFCPEEFYCRITQHIDNLANVKKIQHSANTDFLTDLPNRRSFMERGSMLINAYREKQLPYCLAMIDIDYFKQINDRFSHEGGDYILKILALYMRKYLAGGILSRLGGAEFAVIFTAIDEDNMHTKLDDFRREISVAQNSFEDSHISFSVTIGVTFSSENSLTEQMSEADKALASGKENGRNQVSVFGVED